MDEAFEQQVLERLDLLVGVVQLAYNEEISDARNKLRGDPVTKSILEATEEWETAGELIATVMSESSAAKRTVQRRIAELLARRVLKSRGAGYSTAYRSTGLI